MLVAGQLVTISRGNDWNVSWTPGASAGAQILLALSSGPEIKCLADDKSGTLSVPSSLLGQLTGSAGAILFARGVFDRLPCPNASVELALINGINLQMQLTP